MLSKFNSIVLIFCYLAVMVEGDESSRLRTANKPGVLAGYRQLLTILSVNVDRIASV